MGLDEWIEIRAKDRDVRALNLLNNGEEEYTEYLYWRKDNLILGFFANRHEDFDNCIRVQLKEEEIKDLIELLKNPEDNEDYEPEFSHYQEDIEKLTKLLEMFEEYDVFFYAWW